MTDKTRDILAHAKHWQNMTERVMPADIIATAESYAARNVARQLQIFRAPTMAERHRFAKSFGNMRGVR